MTRVEGFIEQLNDSDALLVKVDRTRLTLRRHVLPGQVQVGDFVFQTDDTHYQIDPIRTEKRRREMRRLAENCQD
ncbi:MAG: DUF3006 domain-containing protein [Ruminococcaceae bacterium]|jgi:hypothetical protein|nr:DUF3006 domain-containing protein [Oscillospiraceae bacterium]